MSITSLQELNLVYFRYCTDFLYCVPEENTISSTCFMKIILQRICSQELMWPRDRKIPIRDEICVFLLFTYPYAIRCNKLLLHAGCTAVLFYDLRREESGVVGALTYNLQ